MTEYPTSEARPAHGQPGYPPGLPKPAKPHKYLVVLLILAIMVALILPLGILFHNLTRDHSPDDHQPVIDLPPEPAPTNPPVSETIPVPEPEPVVVETSEPVASLQVELPAPAPTTRNGLEEFKDRLGYYRLYIPPGFSSTDTSQGTRSKNIIRYASDLEIIVIADDSSKTTWNPQSEMNRKLESIRGGQAGLLSTMQVQSYGLVAFGVIKGYEIALKTTNSAVHTYSLHGNGLMLSLSMEAKNPKGREMSEKFREAFQKNLELYEPGSATGLNGSEDWAKARQSVQIQGIVQSGGKNALLINNRIVGQGEIIRTFYQDREFKFRVESIGNEQYDVRLEPITP